MAGENTKVYLKQGGDALVVDSGGSIDVKPGGKVAGISLGEIPTADPEDGATIWNDNGVLKVASNGG